jgi:hypothetical protein
MLFPISVLLLSEFCHILNVSSSLSYPYEVIDPEM